MNRKPRWTMRWLQLSLCLAVLVFVVDRWHPDRLAFATNWPAWSKRSVSSDHRLVIADFVVPHELPPSSLGK